MRIILIGLSGAMGQTIKKLVDQSDDQIVAGLQDSADDSYPFPVFTSFEDLEAAQIQADVIIDFSHASLTDALLDYAVAAKLPMMLATTGQSSETEAHIEEASQEIAILNTHNTSIGVNILQYAVQELTKKLYPLGYDIEVIEKHHRYKKDAPSGTALMMIDAIKDGMSDQAQVKHGRSGLTGERDQTEIGVHAIRAGDIVGEHTVLFANNQEVIEVTHRAGSKEIFANGALAGAAFVKDSQPGLYTMFDALAELN